MIDYEKTNRGDILKVVSPGAPGFVKIGDLVRVLERTKRGVVVENKHGEDCEFVFDCGAARLEPTEWKNDFPDQKTQNKCVDCDLDKLLAEIKKQKFKCQAGPLELHRGYIALVKKATVDRVTLADGISLIVQAENRYEKLRMDTIAPDALENLLFQACNCLKKILEGKSLL